MSHRINVRLADSRRGSSAFVAIVAVLLLIGAGVGGWWFYTTKMAVDKGGPAKPKTAADSVSSLIGDLEASLKNIATEPAKADEEIESIKKLADEDIGDLAKQVAGAPADVKASIVAMLATKLKDLQPLVEKAYLVPGVKEKLEPIVAKIMTGLKALGG